MQNPARLAVTRIEILLGIVVLCGASWLLVPAYGRRGVAQKRQDCLANLERVGQGLASYLKDSGDHWPFVEKLATEPKHAPAWPTLAVILKPYLGENNMALRCPADRRELESDSPLLKKYPASTTWYETEGSSYEWQFSDTYGGKKVGDESLRLAKGFGFGRADQPLIRDFETFHRGDGGGSFNTLNADLKPRPARDSGTLPLSN